jgi:hypothetical protein
MSKLLEKFKAPDNKLLSAIANSLLYIAAPLGTIGILILKSKGIIDAETSTELIAAWASLVGSFKLMTKFSSDSENA